MEETLDELAKRLTKSRSRTELEEILDILDPGGFIIPSEIFSGKGPLGCYYRTSYENGLHRLLHHRVGNYEEGIEALENQILRELLETIITELQFYYGTNSSKYSFYDVFIGNVSPDLDNHEFLASLLSVASVKN